MMIASGGRPAAKLLLLVLVGCTAEPPRREVPTAALTYYSRATLWKNRGDTARAAAYLDSALAAWPKYEEACTVLKTIRPVAQCG